VVEEHPSSLGPYKLESPLGAGRMGEVYRARDTRLQRDRLFLIVVANVLIFTTEARVFASMFCLVCGLEMWRTQTIVPASLFIAFAPPAKAFLARPRLANDPAASTTLVPQE